MKKHFVFVYGSLMKGYHNDHILAEAAFIRKGTVAGLLYKVCQHFHGMVQGDGVVHGEVYEVDEETLKNLDRLESYYGPDNHDNQYNRESVPAVLEGDASCTPCQLYCDGALSGACDDCIPSMEVFEVKAWAYFYNSPVRPETFIPSGNWRDIVLPVGYDNVEVKGYPFVTTKIRELAAVPHKGRSGICEN